MQTDQISRFGYLNNLPLNTVSTHALEWAITTHKSQGRTLESTVIDLGSSERCSGVTLVALSRVKELKNILLQPFSHERLRKVNKSKQLASVQSALTELERKFARSKERYNLLWNGE